jgi:RNA polymerase sigma-70 factor (ECF subfamily)
MNQSNLSKRCLLLAVAGLLTGPVAADQLSLQSAPPVVVKTVPVAGSVGVDPGLTQLEVTFSKPMQDQSWSWSTWGEDTFPEVTGKPHYLPDHRTCVLPVKLEPGRFYATWLNSGKFHGFQATNHQPATPYLLTFETAAAETSGAGGASKLNADQRAVLDWTERAFRRFFDSRSFEGWSEARRLALETNLLATLGEGPVDEDYYRAIGSLGALRCSNAVRSLLVIAIAPERKDNRERWMAVRALGLIRERRVVPDLVHLLYHYNANTRWWAQISLVRLTGVNFGTDWRVWGDWWMKNHPSVPPGEMEPIFGILDGARMYSIVRWSDDAAWTDPTKLDGSVASADESFLRAIKGQ